MEGGDDQTEDPTHPLLTDPEMHAAPRDGGTIVASHRSGVKGASGRGGNATAASGRGSVARGGSVVRGSVARGVSTVRGGSKKGASARDYGITRNTVTPCHLAVERLYAKATTVFPTSAILDIFIAQVRTAVEDVGFGGR